MGKKIQLSGKYNKWTVLEMVRKPFGNKERILWKCECECGKIGYVPTHSLRLNKSKSCGCDKYDKIKEFRKNNPKNKNRSKVSKEYRTYTHMKTRCYNPNYERYDRYGGRGIKVCERWLASFDNFLSDMGLAPTPKHSIDRINNDGDYEPSNCKWSTQSEQVKNKTHPKWSEINKQKASLRAKKKPVICYSNNTFKVYDSIKSVVKDGFDRASVSKVCSGKQTMHKGFNWKYV